MQGVRSRRDQIAKLPTRRDGRAGWWAGQGAAFGPGCVVRPVEDCTEKGVIGISCWKEVVPRAHAPAAARVQGPHRVRGAQDAPGLDVVVQERDELRRRPRAIWSQYFLEAYRKVPRSKVDVMPTLASDLSTGGRSSLAQSASSEGFAPGDQVAGGSVAAGAAMEWASKQTHAIQPARSRCCCIRAEPRCSAIDTPRSPSRC